MSRSVFIIHFIMESGMKMAIELVRNLDVPHRVIIVDMGKGIIFLQKRVYLYL